MAEPISWQVLGVVKAMIEKITIANGYHTDLGAGLVLIDRSQLPEEDAAFTIIIAGAISAVAEKSSSRISSSEMEIIVEFALPMVDGTNPELLAHRGRADIVRALKSGELPTGAGMGALKVTGSAIGTPDGGAAIVIAQVTARAGLTETNVPA